MNSHSCFRRRSFLLDERLVLERHRSVPCRSIRLWFRFENWGGFRFGGRVVRDGRKIGIVLVVEVFLSFEESRVVHFFLVGEIFSLRIGIVRVGLIVLHLFVLLSIRALTQLLFGSDAESMSLVVIERIIRIDLVLVFLLLLFVVVVLAFFDIRILALRKLLGGFLRGDVDSLSGSSFGCKFSSCRMSFREHSCFFDGFVHCNGGSVIRCEEGRKANEPIS